MLPEVILGLLKCTQETSYIERASGDQATETMTNLPVPRRRRSAASGGLPGDPRSATSLLKSLVMSNSRHLTAHRQPVCEQGTPRGRPGHLTRAGSGPRRVGAPSTRGAQPTGRTRVACTCAPAPQPSAVWSWVSVPSRCLLSRSGQTPMRVLQWARPPSVRGDAPSTAAAPRE